MTTDIAVRGHDYNGRIEDYDEYDENSSARLFERSRIKALAGLSDEKIAKMKMPLSEILDVSMCSCLLLNPI
ncbi:unnamed protein product [Toxocara canis]|uniref:Actin-related protein 2/3 complex subunit 5 n=1 Tax=Toxocara canis TaxID=6265 RepID=A0A183U6B9_TOXCA|nr:unnamed protein product [Toxocara canis]